MTSVFWRRLGSAIVITAVMLGPLGVIRAGAEQDLVNVPEVLEKLRATSFYIDEALILSTFGRWLRK
ncbi:MAG: hypothetical protein EXQ49_10750 [Acidobacteria bacterium]|nr:hypothetical protein [Acidobacteriota bacterium]